VDIEVIDGMKEYADSTGKFTSVKFFVHRVVFFPGGCVFRELLEFIICWRFGFLKTQMTYERHILIPQPYMVTRAT
jgi:hypothetical protein